MKINSHIYYILAIIVLIVLLYLQESLSRVEIRKKDSVISEKNAAIEYERTNKDKILARKVVAVVDPKDLKESYPDLQRLVREEFKLHESQLKAIIQSEFEARGQGQTVVNNYYDSLTKEYVDKFEIYDGYLRLGGSKNSRNLLTYQYSYQDTATTVLHSNKKWYNIFKKEQLYSTTMFNNKNSKITGTTNVLVDGYRPKRFSLAVGIGYDPFKNVFTPNVGIYYSLIKF